MSDKYDQFKFAKHTTHPFHDQASPSAVNKCVDVRCPPTACMKGFAKASETEIDAFLASN